MYSIQFKVQDSFRESCIASSWDSPYAGVIPGTWCG